MNPDEVNRVENEEDNKSPDKKQIEAEEKEVMLKSACENVQPAGEVPTVNEGPVKTALSTEFTEEGREVKPKFIPIGGIKMPGFFTRNSDKDKPKADEDAEKDGDQDKDDEPRKLRHRLQFLHTCPFTQFLHRPQQPQPENEEQNKENAEISQNLRRFLPKINIELPKIFQRNQPKDPEAALASMETLEDKQEPPNDGMENVKLNTDEADGKVATRLPLRERIRQKKFIVDDIVVVALAILVVLAALIGIIVVAQAGPPLERPLRLGKFMITLTSCGPVEGVLNEGVYSFYNIPYAVPPVDQRRFTYAEPLNNISMCWNGTRVAHEPGPVCLQYLENGTTVGQEDCLTLDVVTPHVRYDSPLPVVVLIGANTLAGGISPLQPSPMYARTKEVVFVRPNFRLGVLGFLALDVLSKTKYPPTSGNYGLSDLMVALKWIRYNIRQFGGDPESVTLFGHRAGATLTAALTTVKKAQDLYSRVWLSSPSVIFPGEDAKLVEKDNEAFQRRTKCEDAACLRRIDSTQIISATPEMWLSSTMGTLPTSDEYKRSWLVLDGDLLRAHPYEVWDEQKKAKNAARVKPVVFGTTEHSAHTELLRMRHVNWTSEDVERAVNESALVRVNGSLLWEHFDRDYNGLVAMTSYVRTLCPLVSLARLRLSAPLYVARSGLAASEADVSAILGSLPADGVPRRRFMAAMQQAFYDYVWHGRAPAALTAVEQDARPLAGLPACDLLIREDIVPRYAHVD